MKIEEIERLKLWKLHLLFWMCFYLTSFLIVSRTRSLDTTLILTIVNFVSLVPLIYFLLYFLLPKLWNSHKGIFVLLSSASLLFLAYLRYTIIHFFADLFEISKDELGRDGYLFQIMVELLFVLIIGLPLRLTSAYISKIKTEKEILGAKLEIEKKYLKLQLNPHFLFNALNNVYSLSYRKEEATSEMILKISEILQYVLYECNSNTVSINKEVKLIENYIELHKIEHSEAKISFHKCLNHVFDLSPLLFLPLLENAFKFSNLKIPDSYVKINLNTDVFALQFDIENTIDSKFEYHEGGIGIENLRKRLEIYYPGKYKLLIERNTHFYKITIIIDFIW